MESFFLVSERIPSEVSSFRCTQFAYQGLFLSPFSNF